MIEFIDRVLGRPSRVHRLLAGLTVAMLVFLLFYLGAKPNAGGLFNPPLDKLVHLTFFGGMTVLFHVGTGGSRPLTSILMAASLGAVDEFTQSMNPFRVADFGDWLMDVLGACLAIVLIRTWLAYRRSRTQAFQA